jgi:hypothetical protein
MNEATQEIRLDFGARLALVGIVAGFAGTIAAMALPLAYPDMPPWVWRATFWPSLVLMIGAILFLIGDIALQFRSKRAFLGIRDAGAKFFVGALSFAVGLDIFLYSLPSAKSPVPSRAPVIQQPSNQMASRATKFIFACDIPPDPSVTEDDRTKARKQFERDAKAWGDTIGFTILLSDIDNGYRLTIKAETDEAKSRLLTAGGLGIVTVSYLDFRRIGQRIVVAEYSDLPKGFEFFQLFPIDPDNPQANQEAASIERLLNAKPGTCRLI